MPPTDEQLLARYRANYGLDPAGELTIDMVRTHWQLERELTSRLLASTPETRWEAFDGAYSQLYATLWWLRDDGDEGDDDEQLALWPELLGPPPARVYEVGSGSGALARALAARGYDVRATEVTRERGDRSAEGRVTWGQTDGVHLDQFEAPGSYDAVISNQVVEHLHPDDLPTHLRSARELLVPGGRIAFATPHRASGPHDVSRVFASDRPVGMHLREYTYAELVAALADAGFTDVRAPLRVPGGVRRRLGGHPRPVPSRAFARYQVALEGVLGRARTQARRRKLAGLARGALFAANITLVARRA